jgi:hypothetical protein
MYVFVKCVRACTHSQLTLVGMMRSEHHSAHYLGNRQEVDVLVMVNQYVSVHILYAM